MIALTEFDYGSDDLIMGTMRRKCGDGCSERDAEAIH